MTKLFVIIFYCFSHLLTAQNHGKFTSDSFPSYLIDNSIVEARKLESKIKMLEDKCEWATRIGKKVDVFWLSRAKGNLWGHVYEYFLDCDNLRLIYWYTDPSGRGEIVDFMIENLEDDSMFVTSKGKYLKNKKKYLMYLDKE